VKSQTFGCAYMSNAKLLYHITDFSNLESIFQFRKLLSFNKVRESGIIYENIAHSTIQDQRVGKFVPVPPNGSLHDYVPFYFAPKSPMLYAISKGQVDGYTKGQDQIIYLVCRTDMIHHAGLKYVFTDGHAIMRFTDFYNRLDMLHKVDWEVMKSRYWFDTEEDPDRKRRRQAEFLVYHSVPLDFILGFAVKNEEMRQAVERLLKNYAIEKPVRIKDWYY